MPPFLATLTPHDSIFDAAMASNEFRDQWNMDEHLITSSAEQLDNTPPIPWHGFDHDATRIYAVVSLEYYPQQRGWTLQQLLQFRNNKPPLDFTAF
jgi:hypothetical protein